MNVMDEIGNRGIRTGYLSWTGIKGRMNLSTSKRWNTERMGNGILKK